MLLSWMLACRDPEPVPVPPAPDGPKVAFDLTGSGGVFDAPFPSLHRVVHGVVDVSDWPNPDGVPYVDVLIDLASKASGFGTTSGVIFRLEDPTTALVEIDAFRSLEPGAEAFLVALDGEGRGERVPVDVWVSEDGGPFGAPGMVTLLPVQGVPLRPETLYAAVLLRSAGVAPLGVPEALWSLVHGAGEAPEGYRDAVEELEALGVDVEAIAGLAAFRTWDPSAEQRAATAHARSQPPPAPLSDLVLTEVHDTFCVFESTVEMPVYQEGEPPYNDGGGWVLDEQGLPVLQDVATSRLWVTVPRTPASPEGYPVAVMVRTGGGGDRPLIDRGVRPEPGASGVPGTGPAVQLANAGFVGVQVDGPHGGPDRNPTGGDEQFLMFNVGNPVATRDNVRQSALELALLPAMLDELAIDATGCDGASAGVPLDPELLVLLGHSMGATIAPLVVATAPEYDALVLSGAGGSYVYNLVYKQAPIDVRPVAEALLGFATRGRTLREDDPVLQLLQWVSEPADPPVYGPLPDTDVLMVQGIVDHYILPPMANATSLSLGLDLAGPALDAGHPELADMRPLAPLLTLSGGAEVALPASGERLRVVVQTAEDGVEDGHEVLFQTESARHQYRCFLEGLRDGEPVVPVGGGVGDPCR